VNVQSAAKYDKHALDLSGAFIRRTNLDGANLTNADLSEADCTNASFRGVNFTGALLNRTVLKGADLTDAIGLTREQLSKAIVDKTTILPDHLR
jgi:uncharacterized protein YjbI with pentapeptide repeats